MKKLALFLAFAGLFSFMTQKVTNAAPDDPCATTTMTCPDGTEHTVMICDVEQDVTAWSQILCGLGDES